MNSSQFNNSLLLQYVLNFTNVTFSEFINITSIPVNTATWTVIPCFSLIACIFGFIGNCTLLFLFMKDRTLHTAFNIYLINLLTANTLLILIQYPLDTITNLYAFSWFMGNRACTVYIYALFVLQAATGNAHQLIAINRVWAVVHPISYRAHHSIRTAVFLCMGMWVYVHVSVVPGLLLDVMYYRLPVETNGCQLNAQAQPAWGIYTQLVIYDWPVLAMILAVSIIFFTGKQKSSRILRRTNAVAPTSALSTIHMAQLVSYARRQIELAGADRGFRNRYAYQATIANTATYQAGMIQSGSQGVMIPSGHQGAEVPPTYQGTVAALVNVVTATAGTDGSPLVKQTTKSKKKSHANLVLVLLTISFVVCWTPIDTLFTLQIFMDFDGPTFYQVSTVIFSIQPVLDPILFSMALKSIRLALHSILPFGS